MDLHNLPEWDNYSVELPKEVVSDKKERPPLIGKNRYMPTGLYDQPWGKVQDAYGEATLTPYYIEALTSDDDNDVDFGIYGLYSATTHQGSVYKSSQMAIPFLVDILSLDNDAADLACTFLGRIGFGERHFIDSPANTFKTIYYSTVKKYASDIEGYYQRTSSLEAMRLLCFMPKVLPDYLDISYETALKIEKGAERPAYLRQASTLIAQGYIAAERNYSGRGYPSHAGQIGTKLKISKHVDEVYKLMGESPSLLVRGCAAICLVYTGVVKPDVVEMLVHMGDQNLEYLSWVWGDNFKKAWFFAVDTETLIETDYFPTLNYTSKTKEGVETEHYSQSEVLTEAATRVFPKKYNSKKKQSPSLLPNELTVVQKKLLQRMLVSAECLFSYQLEWLNVPPTVDAAKRVLMESDEIICTEIEGIPLWFMLEQAVMQNLPKDALTALATVDVWKVLQELYKPWGLSGVRERSTLSLDKNSSREALLQSLMADALVGYEKQVKSFLNEWLEIVKSFDDDDWSHESKVQKIGICLLSLARSGKLDEKYYPLVRPCHRYAKYSDFPAVLLKEVLIHTSKDHHDAIRAKFKL